ncbi:MAG TPA: FHIPEP family type III secretion protein [Rhodopila sp.]|uniref:FHIPEP family type III secretion protein n=1 Tax=Rhodopila sp. TaxID=2480087 RepID=UPI002BA68D6E|nr:FHIPEP family type III secretion protein [Rhodopila sp.]HVY15643.1 FHIPEP family type III secretion protein [Rhodopila sp.]
MLVDVLFTLSYVVIGIAVAASYQRGPAPNLGRIPAPLISSIVLRWLAGLFSHALLLTGLQNTESLGVLVRITTYIISSQTITVLVFVYISIVAFNFFITSKGISRASEVLARFYLDSVPGRQIAIDADLASGLTDYVTAKASRMEINERSTLYSMLDSISKFMVAENTCSILVLVLFGIGFSITRWYQHGGGTGFEAIAGAGLLWQASQLVSACAYSFVLLNISSGSNQIQASHFKAFEIKAAVLAATLVVSFVLGSLWPFALNVTALLPSRLYAKLVPGLRRPKTQGTAEPVNEARMTITPLTIEVDPLLAAQLSSNTESIIAQIDRLRRAKAEEFGFQFPQVTIVDCVSMEPGRYRICLNTSLLADGQLQLGRVLAIPDAGARTPLKEMTAFDPVYGLPCLWIDRKDRAALASDGYVLTDEGGVLLTHLARVVGENPHKMLLAAEIRRMLASCPNQELVTQLRSADFQDYKLHATMVELLEGGFSLRNFNEILVAVYDAGRVPLTSTSDIVNHIRRALSFEHLTKYRDATGRVNAIVIGAQTTRELEEIFTNADSEELYLNGRDKLEDVANRIQGMVTASAAQSQRPILISKRTVRPHLAKALRMRLASVFVASHDEVSMLTNLHVIGVL